MLSGVLRFELHHAQAKAASEFIGSVEVPLDELDQEALHAAMELDVPFG